MLSLLIASLLSAEIPKNVEVYLEAERKAHESAIKSAEGELAQEKRWMKDADDVRAKKSHLKEIKKLETKLKEVTEDKSARVNLTNNAGKGSLGYLGTVNVARILNEKEFIAERAVFTLINRGGNIVGTERLESVETKAFVVVRGVDTKKLKVDDEYQLDAVFEIVDFRKDLVEKLPVVERIEIDLWRQEWAKAMKKQAKPKAR